MNFLIALLATLYEEASDRLKTYYLMELIGNYDDKAFDEYYGALGAFSVPMAHCSVMFAPILMMC